MANYLYLFSGGSNPQTDSEKRRVLDDWNAWFKKLGSAVVDQGKPIMGQSRTLSAGGKVIPVTGGTHPNGYMVLRAKSIEEAVDLARDCPAVRSGSDVMVYETVDATMM